MGAERAPERALRERLAALEGELRQIRRELLRSDGGDALVLAEALLVTAGGSRFALPLRAVDEVVPIPALDPLPDAPTWVQGMLNLRGSALPVIDVWARISRSARRIALSDLVVICTWNGRRAGLLVQGVQGVVDLSQALPSDASRLAHAEYVDAALDTDAGPVLAMSLPRLLCSLDPSEEAAS